MAVADATASRLCIGPIPRQQPQHRLRQGHLLRRHDIAGVYQQRLRGTHQKVHERRLECGAQVLSQNECLRIVFMHLEGWLWVRRTVLRACTPAHVQRTGRQLRPGDGTEQLQRYGERCGKQGLHFMAKGADADTAGDRS